LLPRRNLSARKVTFEIARSAFKRAMRSFGIKEWKATFVGQLLAVEIAGSDFEYGQEILCPALSTFAPRELGTSSEGRGLNEVLSEHWQHGVECFQKDLAASPLLRCQQKTNLSGFLHFFRL
jgi:hypothetical protein